MVCSRSVVCVFGKHATGKTNRMLPYLLPRKKTKTIGGTSQYIYLCQEHSSLDYDFCKKLIDLNSTISLSIGATAQFDDIIFNVNGFCLISQNDLEWYLVDHYIRFYPKP